jgi:hypothetical protein
MLCLESLCVEISVHMNYSLRLASAPAGERHQARRVRTNVDDWARRTVKDAFVGYRQYWTLRLRRLYLAAIPFVDKHNCRLSCLEAEPQVAGPELLVARQHDRTHPEAGEHREHPL